MKPESSKSKREADEVLTSSKRLASYNMLLQLSFRLLTFLTNAFILRYITRDLLGVVNVRLALVYSTVLFMSREALRRACLSVNKRENRNWQPLVNLVWCSLPVGLVLSATLSLVWIYLLETPDPDQVAFYSMAVWIFSLCAWLELVVEPLWIFGQLYGFVKLKVVAEGLAMMGKCFITMVLIMVKPNWGLACFCIAQAFHTLIFISTYYGYYAWYVQRGQVKKNDDFPFTKLNHFLPNFSMSPLVDQDAKTLTLSFYKQSFLKQILTEGERYVMTILNVLSFADQGVYDVINNLGSLAARFIFLPIEESFYVFFAKMLSRGVLMKDHEADRLEIISLVLFQLLRFVTLVGFIILFFGLPYSKLLLDLYGGSILTSGSGPLLLQAYCFYVLLIAINGTTECFVFASMNQEQIDKYNRKMFVLSFIFLACSYYFTLWLGSVGFILANCFNMALRIAHSLLYIHNIYQHTKYHPLHSLLPDRLVLAVILLSSAACFLSEKYLCHVMVVLRIPVLHVLIGGILLVLVLAVIYLREHQVVKFIKDQFVTKRKVS